MVDYRMTSENINQRKTLVGKSLQECRDKLYRLYGNDYEIVDRRTDLSNGFFGFGRKDMIKVTYIVKDLKTPSPVNREPAAPQTESKKPVAVSQKDISAFEKNKNDLMSSVINNKLTAQEDKLANILKSIQELKSSSGEKHETIKKIEEMLQNNDFTYKYIEMIIQRINSTFSVSQLDDFDFVQRAVVDWIGESITVEPEQVHRRPHVVILVGPTGVGKTTTLVKLAARNFLKVKTEDYKPKLCFISADTMRVGAVEQLEGWGKWFDTEVYKAQNVHDVTAYYENAKDRCDFIFIDTSGYSPNDSTHIGQLKDMLSVPGLNPEIYLTVSATTKSRDLEKIIRNYEPFGYKSVIVTKCDESDRYGNIISTLYEKQKSISFVTVGQHVAKTLQKASVVDWLIRLESFKVDRVHIEDKFGEN